MESMAHPFADDALARQAQKLGLQHVTVLTFGGDAPRHDALVGEGQWARHLAGCAALDAAHVHRSARLVVTPATSETMRAHEAALVAAQIPIDDHVTLG